MGSCNVNMNTHTSVRVARRLSATILSGSSGTVIPAHVFNAFVTTHCKRYGCTFRTHASITRFDARKSCVLTSEYWDKARQMASIAVVATCNLNQWAMDFTGNLDRIRMSIAEAKAAGAGLRLGPELEIPGYGCEDHFLEEDTSLHSWEVLAQLLSDDSTDGLLCDFGMPVMYHGVRYNCRVLCLNRDILLIRPKLFLANDGNYRETRWFTRWPLGWVLKDYVLPSFVADATRSKSSTVPIGPGMLQLLDTVVAAETCEELFTPNSPHITLALNGAEIITNGSGSHHNLRKLDTRLKLITEAVSKSGGVYMYANQIGCDGGRLYFDGCALICDNGDVLAQGSQFSLAEVEVVTAAVDLNRTRSFRGSFMSRCEQVCKKIHICVQTDATVLRGAIMSCCAQVAAVPDIYM